MKWSVLNGMVMEEYALIMNVFIISTLKNNGVTYGHVLKSILKYLMRLQIIILKVLNISETDNVKTQFVS